MSSRGFGPTYSRIEAIDLIRRAPVVPRVSGKVIQCFIGICCFIACNLVSYFVAKDIGIWSLILLLPASVWVSVFLIDRTNGVLLAEVTYQFLASVWPQSAAIYEAPSDRITAASGVVARSLVFLEKEYKQVARVHRAKHGVVAEPAQVPYRLTVASYRLNGNQRVVAFSDGTSVIWYQTSNVIMKSMEDEWWRDEREDESGAASALIELIGTVYKENSRSSIGDVRARLKGHLEADVNRAINAAKWWRLIREDFDLTVHLTDAGQHWYLATADFESARAEERKNMSNRSDGGPQFNIGNLSGIFYYAGKNISGKHSHKVQTSQPSDGELVACLREVLRISEIPWSDSRLADVRQVMENSVAQQNPRIRGITQAIGKLKEICEEVAVGVLGNGAYQLLIQLFL